MRQAGFAKGVWGKDTCCKSSSWPMWEASPLTNAFQMSFLIRPWGRGGDGERKRTHRYTCLRGPVEVNALVLPGNLWRTTTRMPGIQCQVSGNSVVTWDASIVDSPVAPVQALGCRKDKGSWWKRRAMLWEYEQLQRLLAAERSQTPREAPEHQPQLSGAGDGGRGAGIIRSHLPGFNSLKTPQNWSTDILEFFSDLKTKAETKMEKKIHIELS